MFKLPPLWYGAANESSVPFAFSGVPNSDDELTPEEQIVKGVMRIQNELKSEVLDRAKQLPPEGFPSKPWRNIPPAVDDWISLERLIRRLRPLSYFIHVIQ